MKPNVGSFDRNVRFTLGTTLVLLGVAGYAGFAPLAWIGIGQAVASVIAAAIGLILLVTAALRTCLIYSIFGISTAAESAQTEPMSGKPA